MSLAGVRAGTPVPAATPPRPRPEDQPLSRPGEWRRIIERQAGNACSAFGVAGAAVIIASRPFVRWEPPIERVGSAIVLASFGAAIVDTGIQASNVIADGGRGAQKRGNPRSDVGSIAYAATGLIPAASITAVSRFGHRHTLSNGARAGVLVLAGGVLAYELAYRVPRITRHEENLAGVGSLVASLGGFVVARHALKIPGADHLIEDIGRAKQLLLHPRPRAALAAKRR